MFKKLLFAVLVVVLLAGCTFPAMVIGSAEVVTVEKEFAGFSEVEVGNAFRVDIKQGDTYSVVITLSKNLEPYLEVGLRGNALRIYLRPGVGVNLGQGTLEAAITLPALTGLKLSGAARGYITGFESTGSLDVEVSGASRLEGDIQAGDIRMEVSGASRVTLEGSGGDARIEASGASRADLGEFSLSSADVELSGASNATIDTEGRLDVEASGASRLFYVGSPQLGRVNTSGASSIQQK